MPGFGQAVAGGALAWLLCASPLITGRYESFTRKAAQGPKAKIVAVTSFGDDGINEFVAAGGLPDGSIVAFGNAWGPKFPAAPPPLEVGRGRHRRLDPYLKQPPQTKTGTAGRRSRHGRDERGERTETSMGSVFPNSARQEQNACSPARIMLLAMPTPSQ